MWHVQQANVAETQTEPALALPAAVALSNAALDQQLKFRGRWAPQAAPLWPEGHHVLRLQDSLARPMLSRQPDWAAVANRLARQQPLAPLPRRLGIWQAPHGVVLLDTRDHLRVFEDDWRGLLARLLQRRGGQGLEVWRLPGGPSGPWFALGGDVQRRAWSAHTAVLVVSDLGDRDPAWNTCWQDSLLHWKPLGVHLSLLFPGGLADMPDSSRLFDDRLPWTEHTSDAATDDDLLRLSQGLSLAATLEPALVRACRRALVPKAGALLESRLWRQPTLTGSTFHRRWQPAARDELAAALADERRWPTQDLERLAAQIRSCHAYLPQALQDQETLNIAAALASRRGRAGPNPWSAQAAVAAERQSLLVGHLLHGAFTQPAAGGRPPDSAALAAEFAQARVDVMAPQARAEQGTLASQWFALAHLSQARKGQPVPERPGVDHGVLQALLQQTGASPPEGQDSSALWRLIQHGSSLRLQMPEPTTGIELYPRLGPARSVTVTQAGQTRWLPTRLPWQALADLDASDQPIQIQVGASRVVLESVKRPNWAAGWSKDAQGTKVLAPLPWGRSFALAWHPTIHFQSPVQGWGGVGFVVGVDQWGLFFELQLQGSATQRFRYIEPGSFLMGSPAGQGDDDEHPQHPVTITQGFWLADTPCTQAFWMAVMDGDNPSRFKDNSHGEDAAQRPVEQVSWEDVVGARGQPGFLGRLAALLPAGCTPALPTEAEWEYAARAGSTTAYAWGDAMDPQRANTDEAGLGRTTPVKQFNAPNAWGLHDVHGNVWEWCTDGWRGAYQERPEVDPVGPKDSAHRVVRGGSWSGTAGWARSAYRLAWHPVDRWDAQGLPSCPEVPRAWRARVLGRAGGQPPPPEAARSRRRSRRDRWPGWARPLAAGPGWRWRAPAARQPDTPRQKRSVVDEPAFPVRPRAAPPSLRKPS